MSYPWAADIVTTGLVLLLVETMLPITDHMARVALGGWWPWAITVVGFLALRLVVAGVYGVMRLVVDRMFPRAPGVS